MWLIVEIMCLIVVMMWLIVDILWLNFVMMWLIVMMLWLILTILLFMLVMLRLIAEMKQFLDKRYSVMAYCCNVYAAIANILLSQVKIIFGSLV